MVRQTLSHDSVNLFTAFTDGHGCTQQIRDATNTDATSVSDGNENNKYVRIIRKDNMITAYKSSNGEDWMRINSYDTDAGNDLEELSDRVFVGFAATSHTESATRNFVFEEIEFTTNTSSF